MLSRLRLDLLQTPGSGAVLTVRLSSPSQTLDLLTCRPVADRRRDDILHKMTRLNDFIRLVQIPFAYLRDPCGAVLTN